MPTLKVLGWPKIDWQIVKWTMVDSEVDNVRLADGRTYNVPTVSKVAALFDANSRRDIIFETQNGQLQRIHESHSIYLGLQFPLLFPYGED